jgi:hypothetical protein
MAYQYQYGIYNPGQYPADAQAAWDAMVADGWQVHTALPNYSEICIFWQRELPEKKPGAGRGAPEGDKGSA